MASGLVPAASPNRSSSEWRNAKAFAALTSTGEIRAWGAPSSGGLLSSEAAALSGVRQVYSTETAFAALTSEGEVVAWGGNGGDTSGVQDRLQSGIRSIASTTEAFAALDVNGAVTTWGTLRFGGDTRDLSDVLNEGVVEIFSTDHAFAALKRDGSVVGWGDEFSGGFRGKSGIGIAENVRTIRSTTGAFAALLNDGTVQTWGYWNHGGVPEGQAVLALASGQVRDVFSNDFTFAALLEDGSVISWGSPSSGGDTSSVEQDLVDVQRIIGNRNAFTAITGSGKAVSWGISGANYVEKADQLASGVIDVVASDQAFAALKDDGSVVTWGSDQYGANSSAVAGDLASGVVELTASEGAFAARKRNGQVVTWGASEAGGDSLSVQAQLLSGVEKVYANQLAFAAVKEDGTVVTWGDQESGGSSRFATGGDLVDVVNIADVFTDTLIGDDFSDSGSVDPGAESITQVLINPINVLTSERRKKDKITGTDAQDLFLNGPGADRFKGKGGADIFWFNRQEPYGKKHAEKILDFNQQEDVVILGGSQFLGMSDEPKFISVVRKSDYKDAAMTDVEFIYWSKKGRLYFNSNGDESGFGEGGLFARLSGAPDLSVLSVGFTE